MIRGRALAAALIIMSGSAPSLQSADFSTYRGFRLGSNLSAASKQAGAKPSEARTIHKRPAVLQEMDWRPSSAVRTASAQSDPVHEVLLRFYNGDLYQIVTIYDREKVEGMAEADMVEAISATYGPATKPAADIPFRSNYGEVATVLARWETPEYVYNLVRTGDRTSFALILSLKQMETLARAAMMEAERLDALEAPQRILNLQKQQEEDSRLLKDKARITNKPNFRP